MKDNDKIVVDGRGALKHREELNVPNYRIALKSPSWYVNKQLQMIEANASSLQQSQNQSSEKNPPPPRKSARLAGYLRLKYTGRIIQV